MELGSRIDEDRFPTFTDSDVLTFLFTDIEASTQRWEGAPDSMSEDLGRHDEVLRSAVGAGGGEVFAHTGDGLAAVFTTPAAAVMAAVAGQRALRAASWSGGTPLMVRMAVHAGTAVRRAGNYFGSTVNRTARLVAIGWGGQVLCSETVARRLDDKLGGDFALVCLGDHRLVGFSGSERVFQVAHSELTFDFPPLRSVAAARQNLPVALTRFVGRASELQEIVKLLGAFRLLTLTGVGGAGKTRLAVQAAGGVTERYPDGVWLVELAELTNETSVPLAVAAAVGATTSGVDGEQAGEELVCRFLAGRRALLVLDNCEHLVAGVAGFVHSLLSRCPGVNILATSREVLGLAGEVTFPVPPLSLPSGHPGDSHELLVSDAVALFCDRAAMIRADFKLTRDNAGAVCRICRRVDGIPLALELAAARLRALTVEQIADRLENCFRLLSGGFRIPLARHQTLRATLDWSHELLSPPEQTALRRLAVFPDSFDLGAACRVIAETPCTSNAGSELDGPEVVSRLVDKSLVVVSTDGGDLRFRLLEPVRQYAAEHLAELGETDAARRCHRDYFLSLCDVWHGSPLNAQTQLRRVDDEKSNFRAALEWSWNEGNNEAALRLVAVLARFWLWMGHGEAREWLERVLAQAEPSDSPARAHAMACLAVAVHDSGRQETDRPEWLLREAVAMARRVGDPEAIATCGFMLSELELARGNTRQAKMLIESALHHYESWDSHDGVGWCYEHLGWAAVAEDNLEVAAAHFERAVHAANTYDGGEWLAAHALAALAPVTLVIGADAEQALRRAEEAIQIARGLPGEAVLLMALVRGAETAVLADNYPLAGEILIELLNLLQDLATRRWVADTLELTALVLERRDKGSAALRLLNTCDALRRDAGDMNTGVRSIARVVQRSRDRLNETTSPRDIRHPDLSPEGAIAEALGQLRQIEPNRL